MKEEGKGSYEYGWLEKKRKRQGWDLRMNGDKGEKSKDTGLI